VNKKLGVGMLIGAGLVIIAFFGFRLMHELKRWGPPPGPKPFATTTDVTLIREWMTVPYIAHTYAVPDRMLFDALEIPEKDNRKKSLLDINNEYFPEQDGLVIALIQEAILAFQGQVPLPPMPPLAPTVTSP
jgi:hypothetical protein